jgi:hypothetical protein
MGYSVTSFAPSFARDRRRKKGSYGEQITDEILRPGSMMEAENSIQKQRGRPFVKGLSGNPAGKPKGTRNRSTLAAEALLDGEAEKLTRKAIDMALGGDVVALKLCMERILPPRKDRLVQFDMPALESAPDALGAIPALLRAVSEGRITPSEAETILGLIDRRDQSNGQSATIGPLVLQPAFIGAPDDVD